MELPDWVLSLLERYDAHGYEAYAVGGCLRDSLLGRPSLDFDLATSARPEQTKALFADAPVYETGLRHGTVTVKIQGHLAEITTFRREGPYSDRRHPDEVLFTDSLEEDLKRRDFTINAMAYHPSKGLIDPFDGRKDLEKRILRCVGNPTLRFQEDALRILRALRFSAVLGVVMEPNTRNALLEERFLLKEIARERVRVEFGRILCAQLAYPVLTEYEPVFSIFLPEIYPIPENLSSLEPEEWLRLAVLFSGCTPEKTESALKRLRYDGKTIALLTALEACRDLPPTAGMPQARRLCAQYGRPFAEKLLRFRRDQKGQELLCEIEKKRLCCSLEELAVTGKDLIDAGILPGKQLGNLLNALLDGVMEETLPNERQALLKVILEGSIPCG